MKKLSTCAKRAAALVVATAMIGMFIPSGFFRPSEVSAAGKTVTSVSVKSKPAKLKYNVGDKLSTKGLKLTVRYKGGSKGTVSSGFTCTPTKLSKACTQKITVKYKGKKTSFNVTVSKAVKSVKIKSKPSKLKYRTGETLSTSGLKLTVTYTDKSSKTVTSGFTCTPTKFTKTGTQKVTVKYGGKSATFNVTVSNASTTSLPKLTNGNAKSILEKHLKMWIGLENDYAAKLDVNDHFTKKINGVEREYYRAKDYKTYAAYQSDVKKYIVTDKNTFSDDSSIVKNGKLYLGTGYKGYISLDLKSVKVKANADGTYKLYVDCYNSGDMYDSTFILSVAVVDNQYKIKSLLSDSYDKSELFDHFASDSPDKHRLVYGV